MVSAVGTRRSRPFVEAGIGWPGRDEGHRPVTLGWPELVRPLPTGSVVPRGTTTAVTTLAPRPATAAPPATAGTPLADAVAQALAERSRQQAAPPPPRPAHTRVLTVTNQKGGVGKTTTTVNLAVALAELGMRVLVLDLDPQGNCSTALGVEHRRGTPSSYDVLVDGTPLVEVAAPSPESERLLVVPATIDLAGAEIELVSVVARENRLKRAVHGHPGVVRPAGGPAATGGQGVGPADRIDYVLVDCPPSLGLLTLNALVAADELLLPIQTEYYALEGVGQLVETVELVRTNLNPALHVSTVLLTMFDARTRLSAGVADEVRAYFGDRVLRTAIPRSVRVSEAPSYGQSVITYDPTSPGALCYREAARELALRGAPA
jgi:chromosome partitioning protein